MNYYSIAERGILCKRPNRDAGLTPSLTSSRKYCNILDMDMVLANVGTNAAKSLLENRTEHALLRQQIVHTNARVDDVKESVTALRTEMLHGFEQVYKRFEQVDKRFEQVDKRFEQVDKRFEKFEQNQKADHDLLVGMGAKLDLLLDLLQKNNVLKL
jgi:predicted nuclease with TOPRIM domain